MVEASGSRGGLSRQRRNHRGHLRRDVHSRQIYGTIFSALTVADDGGCPIRPIVAFLCDALFDARKARVGYMPARQGATQAAKGRYMKRSSMRPPFLGVAATVERQFPPGRRLVGVAVVRAGSWHRLAQDWRSQWQIATCFRTIPRATSMDRGASSAYALFVVRLT